MEHTFQYHIRKLESLVNQKEQLYKILNLYMDLFPVLDSYLFRYSPLEYLGEGIICLSSSELVNIRELRDDVQTLPLIFTAIRERRAQYCTGMEYYLKHSSCKYADHPSDSLAVTPIRIGSVVIGYICSTRFVKGAVIDDKMLSSLTMFGKLVGKVLDDSTIVKEDTTLLSKRELEVMKRIARGESTKEMADYMEIGEVTVKQYVKSAIKKLGAQNRAHAVAELFQKGIIKVKT